MEETAHYHRTLILIAKELPAHAGITFPTTKAAQDWLARTRKNPRTAIDVLHNGVRVFSLTAARIRRNQPRARKETCIVLIRESGAKAMGREENDAGPDTVYERTRVSHGVAHFSFP